jgi:Ca-activated chloride channel homolog
VRIFSHLTFVTALLLGTALALAEDNVLFIFDASGSMKKEIDGKRRIDVAKEAFVKTVLSMPQSARTGLMVFGAQRAKDCSDIAVVSPVGSGAPGDLVPSIVSLEAKGETPIADAVAQGAQVLEQFPGAKNSIVLLTDGIEECKGDPCAAAAAIRDKGVGLKVNIVGFTLDSQQRESIECLAKFTGGQYYDAANADALVTALSEVAQATVAETPPPEPPPPAEKPRKVIFSDEFEGSDLVADNWDLGNPNTDSYIVEKGNLLMLATAPGGFVSPDATNMLKFKQTLPEGDYTVTVKFKVKFATGAESLTVGLFEDQQNYIAASLNANYARYGVDWIEVAMTKLSKGQETAFKPKLFETSGTGYDTSESYAAAMNEIGQPITLKLIKTEREFRASLNFEGQKDDKGEAIWTTTDPVSSLRPPKLLMLTTGQTSADTGGESSFFIDSVTIDVPGE